MLFDTSLPSLENHIKENTIISYISLTTFGKVVVATFWEFTDLLLVSQTVKDNLFFFFFDGLYVLNDERNIPIDTWYFKERIYNLLFYMAYNIIVCNL